MRTRRERLVTYTLVKSAEFASSSPPPLLSLSLALPLACARQSDTYEMRYRDWDISVGTEYEMRCALHQAELFLYFRERRGIFTSYIKRIYVVRTSYLYEDTSNILIFHQTEKYFLSLKKKKKKKCIFCYANWRILCFY